MNGTQFSFFSLVLNQGHASLYHPTFYYLNLHSSGIWFCCVFTRFGDYSDSGFIGGVGSAPFLLFVCWNNLRRIGKRLSLKVWENSTVSFAVLGFFLIGRLFIIVPVFSFLGGLSRLLVSSWFNLYSLDEF